MFIKKRLEHSTMYIIFSQKSLKRYKKDSGKTTAPAFLSTVRGFYKSALNEIKPNLLIQMMIGRSLEIKSHSPP